MQGERFSGRFLKFLEWFFGQGLGRGGVTTVVDSEGSSLWFSVTEAVGLGVDSGDPALKGLGRASEGSPFPSLSFEALCRKAA